MTDTRPRVNRPFSGDIFGKKKVQAQSVGVGAEVIAPDFLCAVRSLANVLTGPTKEGTELVRKDHEVDDERYWGQHKYQISHGSVFPVPIC
jgi:hypothetical protein